jgi:hypothetical protein
MGTHSMLNEADAIVDDTCPEQLCTPSPLLLKEGVIGPCLSSPAWHQQYPPVQTLLKLTGQE